MADIFAELKESLAQDLKLQFEALAQTRQSAAGGSSQAAAILPTMSRNLKDTSDLFGFLNVLLRDTTREQQVAIDRNRRKGREEQDIWGRVSRAALRTEWAFMQTVAGLAGVPASLADLVRKTTGGTGDHSPLSTLQKSLLLAILPLGQLFIPAIAWASKRLQDFANSVDMARRAGAGPLGQFGGGLRGTGIPGIKQAGEGYEKLDWFMYGQKKQEESGDSFRRIAEDRIRNMGKAEFDLLAKVSESRGMTRTVGGERQPLDREAMARFFGEGSKSSIDILKAFKEDPGYKEAVARDRGTVASIRAQVGFQRGGLAGILPGVSRGGLAGESDREGTEAGGRKRGYATDILPPGYQARYSEVADIREQMQVAAFNTTELDRRLWEKMVELQQQMLKEMQDTNARGDQQRMPAR